MRVAVVHIVREFNGLEPFVRFLNAYRANPPGQAHELVLVWKGFKHTGALEEYLKQARDVEFRSLQVPDWGYDIGTYGTVLRRLDHEYFCFLNSFSEPLAPGWLASLWKFAQEPCVGMSGATGSWESLHRNHLLRPPTGAGSGPRTPLSTLTRRAVCKALFPGFPNWHLRTNAFVIRRELALKYWPKWILCKRHSYLFESGRWSITRRVLKLGLQVVVVGRDGRAYLPQEWPRSRTFRSGSQENLLVADRQTREFEAADPATRRWLAYLAWGDAAEAVG